MLKSLITAACCFIMVQASAQIDTVATKAAHPDVFQYVEKMPKAPFNIGEYLGENIKYPKKARKENIAGRVIVRFIVTETGEIDSARIIKGIGGGCDEEALRVVEEMPKWSPGTQNGVAVKVYFNLPIMFILED
ncbi:hypothetical protein GCM10023093_02330 [Nemorincola caseinilytica]|uniref:TonB C-terminal domain-containing protein n=1 Tax=Nemorincola caseinilytica TaxID=2054315 RepID=A0ABP8N2G0_9BACT